jgi:hypothetical protein
MSTLLRFTSAMFVNRLHSAAGATAARRPWRTLGTPGKEPSMQNPAINLSDLPSIDLVDLSAVLGGEGWGQWVGKYAGAALGGGLGALGGTAAGTAIGGPVGGVVGGGAGGGLGGALGYDYGGQFGNWLTGGR